MALDQQHKQRQYLQAMGIDVYVSNKSTDMIADDVRVHAEPASAPAQLVEAAVSSVDVNAEKPDLKHDDIKESVVSSSVVALADSALADSALADSALTDPWDSLTNQVKNCTACELSQTRSQAVFGVGDSNADWLIVGESPDAEEDQAGEPFLGEAGRLVNKMLQAINLQREHVYMTSVVKCHSAKNQHPQASQVAQCDHFLQAQIELIKPKIILVFSKLAAQSLLESTASVDEMRGKQYVYGKLKIPLIVTYHPDYLLRAPGEKKKAWNDLKLASRVYKDLLK